MSLAGHHSPCPRGGRIHSRTPDYLTQPAKTKCFYRYETSTNGITPLIAGASRASVRQLAQALAREMSPKGIQVSHCIANGRITDEDNEDTRSGKHIAAEAVGKTYLYLAQQEPTLWTHELDLRPAQEKF